MPDGGRGSKRQRKTPVGVGQETACEGMPGHWHVSATPSGRDGIRVIQPPATFWQPAGLRPECQSDLQATALRARQ